MTTIGSVVKDLRRQHHWSQKQLSDASGLNQGHISDIETGKSQNLTRETISSLASAFSLEEVEFLALITPANPMEEAEKLANQLSGRQAEWAREVIEVAPRLTPNQQRILLEMMREMAAQSEARATSDESTSLDPKANESKVSR